VRRWPDFADAAGVHATQRDMIAAAHRLKLVEGS
jgi:hypothetical protein